MCVKYTLISWGHLWTMHLIWSFVIYDLWPSGFRSISLLYFTLTLSPKQSLYDPPKRVVIIMALCPSTRNPSANNRRNGLTFWVTFLSLWGFLGVFLLELWAVTDEQTDNHHHRHHLFAKCNKKKQQNHTVRHDNQAENLHSQKPEKNNNKTKQFTIDRVNASQDFQRHSPLRHKARFSWPTRTYQVGVWYLYMVVTWLIYRKLTGLAWKINN